MSKSLAPVLRRFYGTYSRLWKPYRLFRPMYVPKEISKCIYDPTENDIMKYPDTILFSHNPTIEMWAIALRKSPVLMKYAPVENFYFMTNLREYLDLTHEHLSNFHPKVSGATIHCISKTVPIDLEMVDRFMNNPTYTPTFEILERALMESFKRGNFDYSKLITLNRKYNGTNVDTARLITMYFRCISNDTNDFKETMFFIISHWSNPIRFCKNSPIHVHEVIQCVCQYYMKYRDKEWLYRIGATKIGPSVKISLIEDHFIDLQKY